MQKTFILLLMQGFMVNAVLAHDEAEHVSDLEQWVAGIGIILILLACVYSLWWKQPKTAGESDDDFNLSDT